MPRRITPAGLDRSGSIRAIRVDAQLAPSLAVGIVAAMRSAASVDVLLGE